MASAIAWSREEEKAFENAIALHWTEEDEDSKDVWRKIANMVPSKSLEDLRLHFQMLVEDVNAIEAGNVVVPSYVGEETTSSSSKDSQGAGTPVAGDKKLNCGFANGFLGLGREASKQGVKSSSKADQERRKGIPWSEEEHRLFLLGLDKFGKGDWRSISRNFVISRTPTQVASHAQKYFIRLNSMNRERRRSSIHDITSVNNGETSSQQLPITGQHGNPSPGVAVAAPATAMKNRPPPAHMPALSLYGAQVGHPVAAPHGHMASAVGTPVMLPPPGHPPHPPPYVVPIAYPVAPIPPPPMHQ